MSGVRFIGLIALVAATHAAAAPYQWSNVAIGGGGFVSGLITSKSEPGLTYARTDVGGAYRWDAKAARWVPLQDWVSDRETGLLGIETLAIDPSAPGKVYMLAGIAYMNGGRSAFLRSHDYGKTWTKADVTAQFKAHGNGMGRNTGEKLQVDPLDGKVLYLGTRANGLFKSVDEGASWRRLDGLDVSTTPNGNGISFVLLDPSGAKQATHTVLLGVSRAGDNLYRSLDAGKSFQPITGGPGRDTGLMPHRAVLADGHLVITYANGAGPWGKPGTGEAVDRGAVWKLHLASGKWTDITPPLDRAYAGVTVDPRDPRRMIVTTINYFKPQYGTAKGDRIFLTRDGGASWTDIVGKGFTLDNKGISWIDGNSIHWAASVEFDPFKPKAVMIVSGNGIFRTENIDAAPVKWDFHVAGLEETVPLGLVSIPGGPLISVIGDYDGFIHGDIGQYPPIVRPTMGTTTGLAYAARSSGTVVRVGEAMYVSRDMGKRWTRTARMHGIKGQVAVNADGSVILHSPEKSGVSYRSTDGGESWSKVLGLDVVNAHPVADTVNPDKFYALDGEHFLVSVDGGASFKRAAGLPYAKGSKVLRPVLGREGEVWVALYDGGLARTTDSGASFTLLPGVTHGGAIGYGKGPAGAAYPTLYLWGTVGGVRGMFCSTDTGRNWARVNDDMHQYGGPGNGQFVIGDMNREGVVYMSTAGRGLVAGQSTTGKSCQ
jgi:hypothetical protein